MSKPDAKTFGSGGPGSLDEQRRQWRDAARITGPSPANPSDRISCGAGTASARERESSLSQTASERLTWVAGDRPDELLNEVNRKNLAAQPESGTSIFDPVICELTYRWFCPDGGSILDPFAGGSVRGIVASVLGRSYTGIDLRHDQIAANAAQWSVIRDKELEPDSVEVKVSAASSRLPFNGCEPDYIRNVCKAGCEFSSTREEGILVTIHPSEEPRIKALGGKVENGLLLPVLGDTPRGVRNRCSFQEANGSGLCTLHFTPDKPFGCIASPFTLNSNGTLIVRHRYISLKCYNDGRKLPAYVAFRASLDLIFGREESHRICAHLEAGGGDLTARMPAVNYHKLIDNDEIKHGELSGDSVPPQQSDRPPPRWLVGDARDVAMLAPGGYDLVFSCPPYADLERYSDNPRDLSTMDYPAFLDAYRAIIAACVGMLRPDRFAVFVVGDIRDKKGFYRNFPGDTVAAFEDAGATLYNEAVLITAVGSLPIRVGKQFSSYRKLGKTHQNVLCFFKGDPRRIPDVLGEVKEYEPEGMADESGLDRERFEVESA
jgi:hypothetical protein